MNLTNMAWRRSALAFCLSAALAYLPQAGAVESVQTVPARDVIPDTGPIPAHVKQKILDHMAQTNLERLRGWPGIIFYCPVEEAANQNVKTVCTAVNAKAAELFSAAKIKFQIAKNAFDVHFLPHMTGRLLLTIDLEATPQDAQPSAIFANVKALAHYAHAVNWSSELTPGQDAGTAKGPLDLPQHVDAVLWENDLIEVAPGSQSALTESVSKGLEQRVQAFITEFTRLNK